MTPSGTFVPLPLVDFWVKIAYDKLTLHKESTPAFAGVFDPNFHNRAAC